MNYNKTDFHKNSLVIDSLFAPGPTPFSNSMLEELDLLRNKNLSPPEILCSLNEERFSQVISGDMQSDYLGWWEKSGVDTVSVTLGAFHASPFSFRSALDSLSNWQGVFDNVDRLVKITSANDIVQAKERNQYGVILNFQNSTHIQNDIKNIDFFYDLGIRIMQLTYNSMNFVGVGCTERTDGGLSNFGEEVIKRMNELGMVVDLSHCGFKTTMDAIRTTQKPPIFSHVVCGEVYNHDRGKSDAELEALAEANGYVGIALVPFFLSDKYNPGLSEFLNHFDHAVEIVGKNRVGIGTDWGENYPKEVCKVYNNWNKMIGFEEDHGTDMEKSVSGYESWEDWPNITRCLLGHGYSEEEVKGFIGENFLSFFRESTTKKF